jgi:GNAT superfamily N-acetyltransferase
MKAISSTDTSVLRNATKQQLEQAIAENHRQLFMLGAVAKGGEVVNAGELSYTWSPDSSASVLFPVPDETGIDALLDDMMHYYRSHPPKNIGYWSLDPAQPADMSARLLARGFQLGWQPCWMAIDLEHINTDYPVPEGLEIRIDNTIAVHEVKELPYGDSDTMTDAFLEMYPGRAQRIVALLNGAIVGHNCLFFTTGPDGIAGLYNVGVLPTFQKQGIGKALVAAACQYARERGYSYTTLNANHIGRRTYEQVGFELVGYGITWWIVNHHFITNPPSSNLVILTEATGRGDITTLEKVGMHFTAADLNALLINGMKLIELAAHFKQSAAAEWLIAHGAEFTALVAWDLGWKDRAAALLADDPQEVNRRYFEWEGTLLHIAALRDDLELARLALANGADLSITDKEHDSPPIGWAWYFKREEMIGLIKKYMLKATK